MTREEDIWSCSECEQEQGRHDQWFEGKCGDCNAQTINNKKKDDIESILIDKWASIGMDIPSNYEDIVQDCFEDVHETADPVNWSNGDVSIAFRRWTEKQGK